MNSRNQALLRSRLILIGIVAALVVIGAMWVFGPGRVQPAVPQATLAPAPNVTVPEIEPRELKARLDRGDDLFILDVREPHEYQICNLGGKLIPLGELPRRYQELDPAQETVVHCRSGVRSAKAVDLLLKSGFTNVANLAGGVLAWADRVDPTMPKY